MDLTTDLYIYCAMKALQCISEWISVSQGFIALSPSDYSYIIKIQSLCRFFKQESNMSLKPIEYSYEHNVIDR